MSDGDHCVHAAWRPDDEDWSIDDDYCVHCDCCCICLACEYGPHDAQVLEARHS